VEVDERGERMNAKIRDAQKQKVPYMLVIGDKEMETGSVALRLRSGENPGPMPVIEFIERARRDVEAGT
jgi:threonyl-tRNA synthetase